MNGLLYVDKPTGWTSFDVVAKIRGTIRGIIRRQHEARGYCHEQHLPKNMEQPHNCIGGCGNCTVEQIGGSTSSTAIRTDSTVKRATQVADADMPAETIGDHSSARVQNWRCKCRIKVGHTGTLDPEATGLLVICVGKYTKKVPELIKQDKTYDVELTLGRVSTTADREGDITESDLGNAYKEPSSAELGSAIKKFVGTIQQTPPIFSAIKVDGKRAYDLARNGKEVKLAPRTVYIHSITDVEYEYPLVRFSSRVGSGTYIRSLAVDIGVELQTGAYMSALRRTSIGDVKIEQAVSITDITEEYLKNTLQE